MKDAISHANEWGARVGVVVFPGLDVELRDGCPNLSGKRIGLVCNHTSVTSDREHAMDALTEAGIEIVRLFGPEHGIRGTAAAGEKVESEIDPVTEIPCTSLYGDRRRPTQEELEPLDVLVYDIQDVGVRFYTYIWTLRECMAAAAEAGVPFVVLDRPALIGPAVEGNVLDEQFSSFVGQKPLAWRFGMTSGELATLYADQGWLETDKNLDLTVVQVENFQHRFWGDDMQFPWVMPSPNIPTKTTCLHYPGTCLFEGLGNVSEGRGTLKPFETIGAPFINAEEWIKRLDDLGLEGIRFDPVSFVPEIIPGKALKPKCRGEKCLGVHLVCTDRQAYRPVATGIALIRTLLDMHKETIVFRDSHFDHLAGTDRLRQLLVSGTDVDPIVKELRASLKDFLPIREKCLLYD